MPFLKQEFLFFSHQVQLPIPKKKRKKKKSPPVSAGDLVDKDVAVMDPTFEGYVRLVVFARDKGIVVGGQEMLHRVGWKRRLLPADCEYSSRLDCFPARLAHAPLPLKLFGRKAVPVPREDFEILKHHFPNNWWREEKPSNCLD